MMLRLRPFALLLAPLLAFTTIAPAWAAPAESGGSAKAITLDYPSAPPALVEVDLSLGLFSDLFGITDSAVQGIVEAAMRFGNQSGEPEALAVEFTAKQLQVMQKVLSIAKQSINGLELRVYDDLQGGGTEMQAYYSKKLSEAGWDRALRVRDGEQLVQVSVRRDSGAIKGAFLIASEGKGELAIALLDCNLSPENAKQLTDAVTTAALDLGLAEQLQQGLAQMKREIEREAGKGF